MAIRVKINFIWYGMAFLSMLIINTSNANPRPSLKRSVHDSDTLLYRNLQLTEKDFQEILNRNPSVLQIEQCRISDSNGLFKSISQLTQLTSLFIRHTYLDTFYFSNLNQSLEVLEINNCFLKCISPSIRYLTNLVYLNLGKRESHLDRNNQIELLPDELFDLTNLKEIYLQSNKINYIPGKIAALKELRNLQLSGNQLASLPKEIIGLEKLESLSLYNNKLTSLPAELGLLKNLRDLGIGGNELSEFNFKEGDYNTLTSLNLYGNPLCPIFWLNGLPNLKFLNLPKKNYAIFPFEIDSMPALKKVVLSKGSLSASIAEKLKSKGIEVIIYSE